MRLSPYRRWLTALIALCSMLFMQLAVSAYACPAQIAGPVALAKMHSIMPDCAGMDMQQPVLCAASAHPGPASLDQPDLPSVAPFIPSSLSTTVTAATPCVRSVSAPPDDLQLTRATAPPLAIQHCRFLN